MSNAADLLRKAADACETYVLSERETRRVKLAALHIIDICGSQTSAEATELIIELLREG